MKNLETKSKEMWKIGVSLFYIYINVLVLQRNDKVFINSSCLKEENIMQDNNQWFQIKKLRIWFNNLINFDLILLFSCILIIWLDGVIFNYTS